MAAISPTQPRHAKTRRSAGKAAGEKKPEAYPLGYVEDFFEPRTKYGKGRVSARRGWVDEKDAIFNIP